MEIDTIVWALEKLKSVSLHKTPHDIQKLGEPWFTEFREMPEKQFKQAINEIVKAESLWPTISMVHKYASTGAKPKKKKIACLYCEDAGFLLIKTQNKDAAYACKCSEGRKKWKNLGIMPYENLGIPWPKPMQPATASGKMSVQNRKMIDTFLDRVGQEMTESPPSLDELSNMMTSGMLEVR